MSLTFPGGPLAAGSGAPDDVNYAIDGPQHRLLMHPFPRRVRAVLGGVTVLDTTRGMLLHESNLLPRFYLPLGDVQGELLARTDHATFCPFKGDASYWSIEAGGRHAENAVWTYEEPIDSARWLLGMVSVYHEAMDAWLDEDEEIVGHLRDPFHRVDARRSSRVVEVRAGDTLVARSERPVVVAETSLPIRLYIPREDVVAELTASDTQAVCPYKGEASYWSLDGVDDVGWSYEQPLEAMEKARGNVAFDAAKVDVREVA
jgi:uncharacterized protein (DUF427 family)